jgi:nucleotide-binding universal stress UspA family protein
MIADKRKWRRRYRGEAMCDLEKGVLMFQHILVPLDGSVRAEQALPMAARIARSSGGSLHLVRVVSPLYDFSGGWAPGSLITEQMIDAEIATANAYLKTMAASPLLRGIETNSEVVFAFGSPALRILEVAEASETDLIVICSHGRTGLTRWALGSVAHTLVHHSTIPLLVLRQSKAVPSQVRVAIVRPLSALVPLAECALSPAASVDSAVTTTRMRGGM